VRFAGEQISPARQLQFDSRRFQFPCDDRFAKNGVGILTKRRAAIQKQPASHESRCVSEPGAVATGQRFTLKKRRVCKSMKSIWPVATAPGSDAETLCAKLPSAEIQLLWQLSIHAARMVSSCKTKMTSRATLAAERPLWMNSIVIVPR